MGLARVDPRLLPAGAHHQVLSGRDVVSGEMHYAHVVWADRVRVECPRCGEPIPATVDVPVVLNMGAGQGGRLDPASQQHGCGEWLGVEWADLEEDASPEEIYIAAREVVLAANL